MTQQTPTSLEASANSSTPTMSSVPPNTQVPLYRAPVQQPVAPEVIRPQGPSVGTIILGTILALLGVITIAFGMNIATHFFPDMNLSQVIAYLLAGTGIVLTLIALEWGITTAIKRRREQSRAHAMLNETVKQSPEVSTSHESVKQDAK